MLISVWLKIIRIKFLLASVIGITNGILYSYLTYNSFNVFDALLTYIGVIFLHASVDILNDYWDYKRGIDTITKRTPFSGGTGVLPDKKLNPSSVYKAGIFCLLIGMIIGIYFVLQSGILVAIILSIAVISIYFYSTTVVNIGLGETLVAVKGTMIVVGSAYVQSGIIDNSVTFLGIIIGLLSSIILFIASLPDYVADKSKGRRTLIIIVGKDRVTKIYTLLIGSIYCLLAIGILIGYLPFYSIITFTSIPFAIKSIKMLFKDYENIEYVIEAVSNTIKFSRVIGFGIIISYSFEILIKLFLSNR
ncbi:MAG TPA: prenyltransferase [Nitrososphaeraceae archaeon]|nr:prenyltransferase [Nitrososphaeraceae archaeon]